MALLCVLAGAGPVLAGEPADGPAATAPAASEIAGRWQGPTYELARRGDDCDGKPCMLTLDVVACATGWCGVEVIGTEQRCGATALRLDGGDANPGGNTLFKGKLELAQGTEPYVVEAHLLNPGEEAGAKMELEIAGDTGGEFRMFRRSFPFHATLVRISDAKCRPETTVSSLAE